MESLPLAIVVLTFNEESNLPRLLDTVRDLPARVVVVDSGSDDRTVAIAESAGASVLSHRFESHAAQWAWALANLPAPAEWVLALDADQRLTPELRQEIAQLCLVDDRTDRNVDGWYICRRQIFRGRWIRHGSYYPKYLLKLFRPECVRFDPHDLVDHHFYVDGTVKTLKGDLIEENFKENDIAFWIAKHLRYAPLLAQEEQRRTRGGESWARPPKLTGAADERTNWIKSRWYRLPLYVRPFLYFTYRYFLRVGFLDGKQGFIFHFLHAFWYRLLVDIYLDDLRVGRSSITVAQAEETTGSKHRSTSTSRAGASTTFVR